MRANVYGIDGEIKEEIELPKCFSFEYRPDLITKAFNIIRSNARQPYGTNKRAGHYVAESFGPGRGISRVPRIESGRGAFAPQTVKGREAHPPKVEKIWKRKINRKEMLLARLSAISATANEEIVRQRGHKFNTSLPIVLDDSIDEINKTKEIISLFKKIGIFDDVIRAKEGKHIRAGIGKARGRKYKKPKSILIVTDKNEKIKKVAGNLAGVDVVSVDELNVAHLAPGGQAGRLTVYTKGAINKLGEKYESI